MDEGLNFKVPFIQSVEKVDIKTQKEVVTATAASKDLQTVTAEVALNYHIHPDKVNKLWQTIGADYNSRIIDPAIHEAVKASTARFTAEELITKRSEVKSKSQLCCSNVSSRNSSTSSNFQSSISTFPNPLTQPSSRRLPPSRTLSPPKINLSR